MAILKKGKKQRNLWIGAAVLAALLVLILSISFSCSRRRHIVPYAFPAGLAYVTGIDVSHHNGDIDWDTVAKKQDFAFIRVGYRGYGNGSLNPDSKAVQNLKGANAAGLPVGVYFYSQAISAEEAREEAAYVLDFIRAYTISLPVVIDFEYPFDQDGKPMGRLADAALPADRATQVVNAFCKTVQEAGYTPGIYVSTYTYEAELLPKKLLKDALIWVADYNKEVTYTGRYDIWQYTKTGSGDGIPSQYVDLNTWYLDKTGE